LPVDIQERETSFLRSNLLQHTMNSTFPATISLPSPRRGRRPGKNKRRNSGNNIATSERVEMTPSLPSVQESNAEVAKLREHLAWTRESYNESLKELQETQAICVADRMELEHLRSVLKDHLVEEKAKAEKERGGYKIGYDSEAEEEYSSPKETKEPAPLPLEKWYQDLQGLIKDKADGELRLKGMANQLRDIKYLMKQAQDENKDLKKQIANLQDGSHEIIKNNSIIMNASMGEGSEHKEEHPFSASIQELQQEVNKWEALYFESAEMGAKTSKQCGHGISYESRISANSFFFSCQQSNDWRTQWPRFERRTENSSTKETKRFRPWQWNGPSEQQQ
jgi:hypothetical protein